MFTYISVSTKLIGCIANDITSLNNKLMICDKNIKIFIQTFLPKLMHIFDGLIETKMVFK